MAIEREIPKDISKYEPKLVGPFTTRQVVFGLPGLALGVGAYFLFRPVVSDSVTTAIAIILAAPLLLCACVKVYGIPFEKFVSIVFVSQVLAPQKRKYHTENLYDDLREPPAPDAKKKKKREKKNARVYSGEFARYE